MRKRWVLATLNNLKYSYSCCANIRADLAGLSQKRVACISKIMVNQLETPYQAHMYTKSEAGVEVKDTVSCFLM